jgi:SAM-dependent methyltransferase
VPDPAPTRWSPYYDAVAKNPPRRTLLYALDHFDAEAPPADRFAVDLGAGTGTDTIEMLRRGWRVLAIDADPAGIPRLRERVGPNPSLTTKVGRFEDERWPNALLVNASFALFFCTQDAFPSVWRRILDSIEPGGRFAGHLLGDRDSWTADPKVNHHTRAQAERLFDGLEIEMFNEEEEPNGKTATGSVKHWHDYHVVARKGR